MLKDNDNDKEEDGCQLKISRVKDEELMRNDLIFYENDIWRCESINMKLFQNLQTKQQIKIPSQNQANRKVEYLRIEKLQLIPKEWKYLAGNSEKKQEKITLKGQQLGLGPVHEIQVVGMRRFEELQVVKSQKLKGRDIPIKVILCKTNKNQCYLIGAIDFLS